MLPPIDKKNINRPASVGLGELDKLREEYMLSNTHTEKNRRVSSAFSQRLNNLHRDIHVLHNTHNLPTRLTVLVVSDEPIVRISHALESIPWKVIHCTFVELESKLTSTRPNLVLVNQCFGEKAFCSCPFAFEKRILQTWKEQSEMPKLLGYRDHLWTGTELVQALGRLFNIKTISQTKSEPCISQLNRTYGKGKLSRSKPPLTGYLGKK